MTELCLVGYTYRGYEMAYALERAKAYGYAAVELRDFGDIDLSSEAGIASALQRASALCRELGIRIHSLFLAALPVSRDHEREIEEALFARAMTLAAENGIPLVHTRLSLLRARGGGEVVSAEASEGDYAAARNTLLRLVEVAAQHGARIAIETHMGTIHDTAASQLRIVAAVDSPHLVASLDFANMLIAHPQERLTETIHAFGGRIGYVHLKNVKLNPWGYDWNIPLRWGDINYRQVLRALKDEGYQGPLAVEYCGTGDPDVFAEDDARYMREVAGDLGW